MNQKADALEPGKVVLRNVDLEADGSYTCEVSSEGTFHTDTAVANLTVIGTTFPNSKCLRMFHPFLLVRCTKCGDKFGSGSSVNGDQTGGPDPMELHLWSKPASSPNHLADQRGASKRKTINNHRALRTG